MNWEIIVHLQGGLGNQLFQYAAAWAVRKASNPSATVTFVLSENPHNLNNHDYVAELFTEGHVMTHKDVLGVSVYDQASPFERWNPKLLPTSTTLYLKGYFQYLPALMDAFDSFCAHIRANITRNIQYSFNLPSTFGFLHIRRGDYLQHPTYHWNQPLSYYERGMRLVEKQNPRLINWLVFSDEPAWCKEQDLFKKNGIVIVDEPDEYQCIYIMSQCVAGAVIANSTFSWWGAILGPFQKRAPVVYPTKWCGEEQVHLFPADWVAL